ncbi:hypothetical protein D3C84_1307640 [compost metagenome]
MITARISFLVRPLLKAAFTCNLNSSTRFSAIMVDSTMQLRVLRSSVVSVQTSPQA